MFNKFADISSHVNKKDLDGLAYHVEANRLLVQMAINRKQLPGE